MNQYQTQTKDNDTKRNEPVWTTTSSPSSFIVFVVTFLLLSTPCCNAFVPVLHRHLSAKIASVPKIETTRFITGISSSQKNELYSTPSTTTTTTTTTIFTADTKNMKNTQQNPMDKSKNNRLFASSSSSTSSMSSKKEKEKNTVDKNNNDDDDNKDVIAPLALLLFSQFLLFIGVGVVIPTIPLYGKEIGLSASASGIVISAPAVALLLGSRLSGQYADMARKPAMIIGMAIIAMSDAGTAFATGLPALIVARLGLGAGRCISEAGERGMLADLASKIPTFRGRALAAQQATVALGIAIGAPFGGVIIEQYGPRSAFLCVTVAAITAMIIYVLLPETIVDRQQQTTTTVNDKIEEDNRKFLQQESAATAEIESEMMGPSEAVFVNDNDGMSSPALNDGKPNDNKDDGNWSVLIQATQWKGLAACQVGTSFGYAAKIGSIPILATDVLPGGAAGAGFLLSAAGLSGILGASIGGVLTDRFTAKFTAILAGIVSATGLFLIPFALSLSSTSGSVDGGGGDTTTMMMFSIPFMGGEMGIDAITFAMLVITWSLGASAQAPALIAIAQQLAPPGREATALALPRAAGDGTYIVAPFLLGLVTDSALTAKGAECAVAGVCVLSGVIALTFLGGNTMNDHDVIATAPSEKQQQP